MTFPIPGGNKGGVGASFSVDYERSRQDEPNPNIDNDTFWIQRATVNTGGQTITKYGQTKTYFDLIDTNNPLNPFYPGGGFSGKTNAQTGELLFSAFDVPYNSIQNPKPSYFYNDLF